MAPQNSKRNKLERETLVYTRGSQGIQGELQKPEWDAGVSKVI